MKDVKEVKKDTIFDCEFAVLGEVEKIKGECWELHKKLSGLYDHSSTQLDDMIKLGKLAEKAKILWEGVEILKKQRRKLK